MSDKSENQPEQSASDPSATRPAEQSRRAGGTPKTKSEILWAAVALFFVAGPPVVLVFMAASHYRAADANFNGFVTKVVSDDPAGRILQLTAALLWFVFALSYGMTWFAKSYAERWNETLEARGGELVHNPLWEGPLMGPQKKRLEEQLGEIQGRARHHFTIFVDFYKWYYMAITTFSVMALAAAVALFFLTRDGWSNADGKGPLITLFVVATAAGVFYKSFISVYRHVENIADNKQHYKNYVALENELRSFVAAGVSAAPDRPKAVADFITYVDKKMADFHNIAVGFDVTKVPTYEGMFDAVGKAKPAPGGAAAAETRSRPADEAPPSLGRHVVQPGDTLWKLSEKYYNDGEKYLVIYWANADIISDPDKIFPGQELRLPPPPSYGEVGKAAKPPDGHDDGRADDAPHALQPAPEGERSNGGAAARTKTNEPAKHT